MILSRFTLKNIVPGALEVPDESIFSLPEKVLQFGTGVLLRGLPDDYIDKANRKGIFNGRIVIVKSTAQGDTAAFEQQDNLYTLCVRGIRNGEKIEENRINSAVSRVLGAQSDWEQILECAQDSDMQVIISNTTEAGIQLVNDDIRRHPPVSFPGKLLAFLYERFRAFGGSPHSGMVIVPTELVENNGKKLESIVLELAHLNSLPEEFIEWLEQYNHFCNSLVDRIVPGRPDAEKQAALEVELGYRDKLLCMAEAYSLWAIEGNEHIRKVLGFAEANEEIVIVPDISLHRELKLRLLNGTHTLSCGPAFLAGIDTVKEATDDPVLSVFIQDLMLQELAPAIPYTVEPAVAAAFGKSVLDRFRNPHIRHLWKSITAQYSSKMKMRCIPLLLHHYRSNTTPPPLFAFGFAAYLWFMKGETHVVTDDQAPVFSKRWKTLSTEELVLQTLTDKAFWETDLTLLPGFYTAVVTHLQAMMQSGIKAALQKHTVQAI